jgi:hypothetical protein
LIERKLQRVLDAVKGFVQCLAIQQNEQERLHARELARTRWGSYQQSDSDENQQNAAEQNGDVSGKEWSTREGTEHQSGCPQVDNDFRHRCQADSFPVGKDKPNGNEYENRYDRGESLEEIHVGETDLGRLERG